MQSSPPEHQNAKRGIDYIGVNCVFWCHDGKGNVLFHKRSKNCRDEQGTWTPAAGRWSSARHSRIACGAK